MFKQNVVTWFAAGVIAAGAGAAYAQNFPRKPIRVVTSELGSSSDFGARLVAQGLSGSLGQQVIVDNRPSGVIPGDIVAKAPPDGYTLLVQSASLWVAPFLRTTPYGPARDFLPITLTAASASILVVHPAVKANSVKELISLAKANPGVLNYSSAAVGTSTHLAGELFKHMAGVNIVRIIYKGSGPALIGLIGGEVQVMFPSAAGVAAHIKAGRLRALAVTSAQPSALFPGMPTVSASGVPGYQSTQMYGMWAPAKTPTAIITQLNQEAVRVLNSANVKEKFLSSGAEVVGSTPEQLVREMRAEAARVGKVIKDAGITAE